ncbi:MAG: hypothetical protein U9P10_04760, partial [Thermodesulfobacteriota bacterium]|nr:hypothetical protein [Thermodesulfobacteriota bacterium]
ILTLDKISEILKNEIYCPVPSTKHISGMKLGRMESTPSLKNRIYGITEGMYGEETDSRMKRDIQDPSALTSSGNMISTAPDLRKWIGLIANTGTKRELFGADFDCLHDEALVDDLFFQLYDYLSVGANVYYNSADQRYIISGNSTGYDVNATYDIEHQVAAGDCANCTYDSTSKIEDDMPDIWEIDDAHSVQIKDVLVFSALDILTE